MIAVDSILHASAAPFAIASCLVFYSVTCHADAPPPETFTKPAELVLTLSDDLPQTENSYLSTDTPVHNNADTSNMNEEKKGALDMNCGMDTSPYSDTGNSVISRLSGACDLKYSY